MFMFILKTDGWHCHKIDSIADAALDAELEILAGYTVAFGDDVDYFAKQMKLKIAITKTGVKNG